MPTPARLLVKQVYSATEKVSEQRHTLIWLLGHPAHGKMWCMDAQQKANMMKGLGSLYQTTPSAIWALRQKGATYVDQRLLYLPVGRHRGAGVLLPPHPGADRLQRAVRAAPPGVIKPVLRMSRGGPSLEIGWYVALYILQLSVH